MEELRDRALAESVRKRLMEDDRLSGQALEVIACSGFIQIVGRVRAEEQKGLAVELAKGVIGVQSVEDRIEICDDPEEE